MKQVKTTDHSNLKLLFFVACRHKYCQFYNLVLRVRTKKLLFFFLNGTLCSGYSKETVTMRRFS